MPAPCGDTGCRTVDARFRGHDKKESTLRTRATRLRIRLEHFPRNVGRGECLSFRRAHTLRGTSFRDLMDLDDVAVRIVEENLLPASHRPRPVIRVGDALFLEALFQCGNVVRAESDVAAVHRIDGIAGSE